jgi:hypothetical protein
MSKITHFKIFVLYKIMWHDVVVIWYLVNDMDILHVKRIVLNDL